jgi:flagellar motor switch protein FliN
MAEKDGINQKISGNSADDKHNRNFADVLGSILESASEAFPGSGEAGIHFSLALVEKMGKEEFSSLVREFPVIAAIALRQQLGKKAAMLTDIQTGSMLAGIISTGIPINKKSLLGDDLVSLFSALSPIVDALSRACEEALGSPLGTIENVEVSGPENRQSLTEELSESLCRATISVRLGSEKSGRIILVLPLDLTEALVASSSAGIEAEFDRKDIDALFPQIEKVELSSLQSSAPAEISSESSSQNIDLILDIQLKLAARLGQVEMPVGEILKLVPGSVLDIDRFVDEPVELLVNDRLIARGEIVVVQENFGIRITEIISQKDRIKSLK